MGLYNELINGPGYAIRPIKNLALFKKARDSFVKKIKISNISKKKYRFSKKTSCKNVKSGD